MTGHLPYVQQKGVAYFSQKWHMCFAERMLEIPLELRPLCV